MKKRLLSLALAAVLILGLAASALAYTTPDFSDLPSDNWAYAPVMRMADQGIIQGTGNGEFSPELKVSVAQFLTLVGRIVFPETAVGANDTWYGPYVTAAQNGGLLTGTQVNPAAPEAEITRYDMAVILRAAAKKLGKTETLAEQGQVTDYGVIPNMYTEAVLAVYGMGLIKGDQSGSFNGSNTMRRNELATVIDRLVALKAPGSTTTEPEKPTESEKPTEPEKPVTAEPQYTYLAEAGCAPRQDYDAGSVEVTEGTGLRIDGGFLTPEAAVSAYSTCVYLHVGDTYQFALGRVPAGYGYADGNLRERVQYWLREMDQRSNSYLIGDFSDNGIWTSDHSEVVTVDENGVVTAVGLGETYIRVQVPVRYYNKFWTTETDRILICVDP